MGDSGLGLGGGGELLHLGLVLDGVGGELLAQLVVHLHVPVPTPTIETRKGKLEGNLATQRSRQTDSPLLRSPSW